MKKFDKLLRLFASTLDALGLDPHGYALREAVGGGWAVLDLTDDSGATPVGVVLPERRMLEALRLARALALEARSIQEMVDDGRAVRVVRHVDGESRRGVEMVDDRARLMADHRRA